MIITLIGFGMLVLGIVGFVLCKFCTLPYCDDIIHCFSIILVVIGIIWNIMCYPFIVGSHIMTDKAIYDNNLERASIVKQVECISSEYEDVSKATVIQNVYEWNKKVNDAKYWSTNPWTSWFWNKEVVDSLEYIDMED